MTRSQKPPKLPVQQLLILSICRFAEPVILTSVFPYLPEMIESFDVPKNKVAKWAGITSAVFSLSQCTTGVAWGRASDRFGRKPIILLGMTCTMLSSLFFGFSRSLPAAIVARSLAGASNGNVGIMRTTVAEMVPWKELQPRAFSVMPLIWTIGSIFGPAFGGALANPASRFPDTFGNSKLLKRYPFALPNIVSSLFFFVGLVTGILFLKETLETRKHRRDYGRTIGKILVRAFTPKRKQSKWPHDDESSASLLKHQRTSSESTIQYESNHIQHQPKVDQSTPSYREVFSRQSNINLLAYSLLALHSVAYDQLLPIFMHHPQQSHSSNPDISLPFKFAGGFGIDSERIGLLFTLYGIIGMIIQFLIFPPVARYYGILPCFKVCTLVFPIVYIITPFTALLPTPLTQQTVILVVMFFKCWAVIFAFPCSTILLTNSAVSLRILGTLNGVATSVSALGRAVGPALAGWTFSMGVDAGYVIVPWWIMAGFAALGAVPVWWLVEMEGFGGMDDSSSEGEDEVAMPNSTGEGDGEGAELLAEEERGVEEEHEDGIGAEAGKAPVSTQDLSPKLGPSTGTMPGAGSLLRRMSSPLGMKEGIGPGGDRRLSNGLGQSRSGFGAAGTSFSEP